MIVSGNKDIIRELFISYPNATYGLINVPEIEQDDYFISFVILTFTNFDFNTKLTYNYWREKWPDVRIYANDVCKIEHVDSCYYWKIDGIITDRPEIVHDRIKYLVEYDSANSL